ncbi:hypothetical protein BDN70DRAFT_993517 [Pholiota conissans]|uniref:F-box domain-containing protein n=1 Tax=Pholiota conissans TaxID=109636 RepID=A0A9P5Z4N0_9AGAR|nr:hypothetical protein BDN70DRAFT_993517 [Pholiota conissans]
MLLQPSTEFPVPPELVKEIITYLSPSECKTFSSVSRLARGHALPVIFEQLRYSGRVVPKIRNIHMARKDVKEVIRKLRLDSGIGEKSDCAIILQFLETLPNLRVFECYQFRLVQPAHHIQLMLSLRHTSLREFVFDTQSYLGAVEVPRPAGLTGLRKFSTNWLLVDNPDEPGSSLAHLYELVRSSLTTLVELRLDIDPENLLPDFDLQLLKPAGHTLRTFEYSLQHRDESILYLIPTIFPLLTKLSIQWNNGYRFKKHPHVYSVFWKESHIEALAKNTNLIDLTLSSDFEWNANDSFKADRDYAWWVRCYERRLNATRAVSSACPLLQHCSWVQMRIKHNNARIVHSFIIEERISDGDTIRVVRGLKQNWMGRDRSIVYNGRITEVLNCKLEALPGDIIGENDPE